MIKMKNYINKHPEKIQNTPGGTLCQVFGANEKANCSIALVCMDEKSNGIQHYHDNITEIYLFSKGQGNIIINGNVNKIEEGDCYIIPPKNTHFIKSDTKMEFACICTPPWTEEHEFEVKQDISGDNIDKWEENGILNILGSESNHNIQLYDVDTDFIPNQDMKKYRRVYYCVSGKGTIVIDGEKFDFSSNTCYEILEEQEECIKVDDKLKFVVVCDKFNK